MPKTEIVKIAMILCCECIKACLEKHLLWFVVELK